jgi:hypothetical protein
MEDKQILPMVSQIVLKKPTHKVNIPKGIYIHHILSSNVNKKETPWFSNCGTPTRASMNVNGITGGGGFLSTGEDSAAVSFQGTIESPSIDVE